jgi:hypothetical protein
MVYLGGPRGRRGRGLYLHDPPPGYRPPRRRLPVKERQRWMRQDWILLRAATAILVGVVVAFIVIISMLIAAHS